MSGTCRLGSTVYLTSLLPAVANGALGTRGGDDILGPAHRWMCEQALPPTVPPTEALTLPSF